MQLTVNSAYREALMAQVEAFVHRDDRPAWTQGYEARLIRDFVEKVLLYAPNVPLVEFKQSGSWLLGIQHRRPCWQFWMPKRPRFWGISVHNWGLVIMARGQERRIWRFTSSSFNGVLRVTYGRKHRAIWAGDAAHKTLHRIAEYVMRATETED
jgi:hypothetical protein